MSTVQQAVSLRLLSQKSASRREYRFIRFAFRPLPMDKHSVSGKMNAAESTKWKARDFLRELTLP